MTKEKRLFDQHPFVLCINRDRRTPRGQQEQSACGPPDEMAHSPKRTAAGYTIHTLRTEDLECHTRGKGGEGGPIEYPPGVGATGRISRSDRHPRG